MTSRPPPRVLAVCAQPKYKDMQLRDDYKPGTYTSLSESICAGLGPLKPNTEPLAPKVNSPRKVKM